MQTEQNKKYKIEVIYETGNSFGREIVHRDLEIQWNNLDIAKENLKRIKEHRDYYVFTNGWDAHTARRKTEVEAAIEHAKQQRWFAQSVSDKLSEFSLMLKTEEGMDFMYSAHWNGYFESLQEAKIVLNNANDDGMWVKFN